MVRCRLCGAVVCLSCPGIPGFLSPRAKTLSLIQRDHWNFPQQNLDTEECSICILMVSGESFAMQSAFLYTVCCMQEQAPTACRPVDLTRQTCYQGYGWNAYLVCSFKQYCNSGSLAVKSVGPVTERLLVRILEPTR